MVSGDYLLAIDLEEEKIKFHHLKQGTDLYRSCSRIHDFAKVRKF